MCTPFIWGGLWCYTKTSSTIGSVLFSPSWTPGELTRKCVAVTRSVPVLFALLVTGGERASESARMTWLLLLLLPLMTSNQFG